MSMASDPRVSVIIPCFNLGHFLPEAIASVRAQTFADFEIIVVDDGSTDAATREAITRLSGSDVLAVRSENRGLPAARNLGISHARGEYISSLDPDDKFDREWLQLAVARLDADPDLAFVSHWLEAFGDEHGEWTPGRSDLAAVLDQNVFSAAALFRKSLVDRVGGFDESKRAGCEDWEFWIRVITAGYRGAIIPAVLFRYRRRPDSMTREMHESEAWFERFGEIIDKHSDTYREHLLDLLLRREWTIARLCGGIDAVREELPDVLEPAVLMRRRELEGARARLSEAETRAELAAARSRVQALEAAKGVLDLRVEALQQSWSWRITAPLRRVYEWLRFR
jgi:glycosyltransferase involved in cell wall biosynthesis